MSVANILLATRKILFLIALFWIELTNSMELKLGKCSASFIYNQYTTRNSSVFKFEMKFCNYPFDIYDSNSQTYTERQLTTYWWNTCRQYCCNPYLVYFTLEDVEADSQRLIDACARYTREQNAQIEQKTQRLGLGLGLGLGIPFLVLIIIVSVLCYKRSRREREQAQTDTDQTQESAHQLDNQGRRSIKQREWTEAKDKMHLKDTTCAVCLENGPSFELKCNHAFHRNCFLACLKYKKECILCRSKDLKTAKVYCEDCFTSYFTIKIIRQKSIMSGVDQICQICHSKRLKEGI